MLVNRTVDKAFFQVDWPGGFAGIPQRGLWPGNKIFQAQVWASADYQSAEVEQANRDILQERLQTAQTLAGIAVVAQVGAAETRGNAFESQGSGRKRGADDMGLAFVGNICFAHDAHLR